MKMKATLALGLAMSLFVSASASNPFADVPAGHWAYDSIDKLAASGVVAGYPDGTFRGNRLMSRYEMAQIVAQAMAKGANVDRLAAEFSEELEDMGVRVTNLEKRSDDVKVTGNIRYSYSQETDKDGKGHGEEKSSTNRLRSRLSVTGGVNDNWRYVGLLENTQNFVNSEGEEKDLRFQRAYLDGRLGGMEITAGRFNNTVADGNLYDTRVDGVKAAYGSHVKVGGYYARPTDIAVNEFDSSDKTWGVSASTDLGRFNLGAGYNSFINAVKNGGSEAEDLNIWNIGARYNFGGASISGMYLHSSLDDPGVDTDGYVLTGTIKGAKASVPGSWGLEAKYYDQGAGTFVSHTMNGNYKEFSGEGFTGYKAAASAALAKNIVATVEYYELKGKENKDKKAKTVWSQMVFTF